MDEINNFLDFNFDEYIIDFLKNNNIKVPTKIQSLVIPKALENKDIVAESVTGSGKTFAYLLPILKKIDKTKKEMQCLILTPTHELAMQITNITRELIKNSPYDISCEPIIGDVNINNQIKKLKQKPQIIIGTTGRILDLIKKKKISAYTIKTIVLDECDNLLNPKRAAVSKNIIKSTMRDRQLMAFSASIPNSIIEDLKKIMKEPVILKTNNNITVNPDIEHIYFVCDRRDKFEVLRKVLSSINVKKSIVFVNNKEDLKLIEEKLNFHKKNAFDLSSSISKEEREKAINMFLSDKINVLVSSDIGARGLDIENISCVFNLDLPLNADDYLHRCGRCGRNNKKGTSISIVTNKELNIIKKYEKTFNIKFVEKKIYKGIIS
ncbi:DEAD/DEAH box helicase [Clostridium sp. BJN0001]|uniref:DEAD/DEAH box helicase n=1 Tax=Clostridium sp. BJN0001 TaxID=2930219 RepID=UPI001FD3C513|nr:DEAD/DEAH box helicase [Clostridium sp. BJN0001]